MSRIKFLCTIALLVGIASFVPQAGAQATLKVMIAGASGTWQNFGTGAYKSGACPTGSNPGCAHYTSSVFALNDSRPVSKGGSTVTDSGTIWIVWDNTTADPNCATACNVWAYIKVDSIVGNRCYFAQPRCSTTSPTPFPSPSQSIAVNIWGADTMPPSPIQALFTTGALVNAANTEVRPEDALFGQCRINSVAGGANDGLAGLGLGSNTPAGSCPPFGAALAKLEGTNLVSAYPGSTATAHPLAFSISGKDPFSGTAIPVYSAVQIGAVPLIIITNRQGALANVKDASLPQLQSAFSGNNCTGTAFTGGGAGKINVYSREPLSGTMNTAEYTLFRLPRDSSGNYDLVNGASQEKGLTGKEPVNGVACTTGGARYQGIGAGEETKFVQNSNTLFGVDGIGYVFFSYGNVSSLADNPNYGYLTVDGVDPIWQLYGTKYDPGQSATAGNLPGTADLPASCAGAFPCAESVIWAGKESFPNVRNGSYRQWAMVRVISDGTALANVKVLVTSAQAASVSSVPDFIPAVQSGTDKGLSLVRSHYTQEGGAPNNVDRGGEEGGCILPLANTGTKLVMREPGCGAGPLPKPVAFSKKGASRQQTTRPLSLLISFSPGE